MRCSLNDEALLFSNCTNITDHDVKRLALVRGATGIACFFLCVATFMFELLYICHVNSRKKASSCSDEDKKANSTTTLQRLFVYLTFSNILYTAALSLHMEEFFVHGNGSIHCFVCKAVGFFDQYSGSVQLLLTIGIIVKLFHKLCSFRPRKNFKKGILSHHHYKFEALFVAACFVLPLLVIWVPFIQNEAGQYGLDGAWCWIQVLEDNCRDSPGGFLEQLLLWYVPYAAVSVLSLICIITITGCLIYICVCHKTYWKHIRKVLLDIMLLLPFLVVFCCVCFIEIAIVVIFKYQSHLKYRSHLNTYVMWMFYAVITPVGGVIIPIAFFVYHLRSKKFALSQKLREVSNAIPRTVNPSNRKTVNSNSDVNRPNFLSPSDVQWSTPSGSAVVVNASLIGSARQSNYGTMD